MTIISLFRSTFCMELSSASSASSSSSSSPLRTFIRVRHSTKESVFHRFYMLIQNQCIGFETNGVPLFPFFLCSFILTIITHKGQNVWSKYIKKLPQIIVNAIVIVICYILIFTLSFCCYTHSLF